MALLRENNANRTLSDQFLRIVVRNNTTGRYVNISDKSVLLKKTNPSLFTIERKKVSKGPKTVTK